MDGTKRDMKKPLNLNIMKTRSIFAISMMIILIGIIGIISLASEKPLTSQSPSPTPPTITVNVTQSPDCCAVSEGCCEIRAYSGGKLVGSTANSGPNTYNVTLLDGTIGTVCVTIVKLGPCNGCTITVTPSQLCQSGPPWADFNFDVNCP